MVSNSVAPIGIMEMLYIMQQIEVYTSIIK